MDDDTERQLESLKLWVKRGAEGRQWLAGALALMEDQGPEAVRTWIGETLTESQARDLLVVVMMVYSQRVHGPVR